MKQIFVIIPALIMLFVRCSTPSGETAGKNTHTGQLPRVLYITSGISEEENKLAQGIVVAIQSFNKTGTVVELKPRDILYNFTEMSKFSIIILSTFEGYHDADRKYSLSYMSDEELHNLARFVAAGGVMISGENVGRNYADGTDRVSVFHELTPENWELSDCYGINLFEKNMTGAYIRGKIGDDLQWDIQPGALASPEEETWSLVPGKVFSKNMKILGYWHHGTDSTIAVIENRYKQGFAYFLSFSAFLQPENDGGLWSEDQIDRFYQYVIKRYNEVHNINASLNPWPSGYDYAFCVSLNAEGEISQYERILNLLAKEKIQPTIFVSGMMDEKIKSYLKKKALPLASNGFSYSPYVDLMYPQAVDDILRNENFWDMSFKGFRFPFTSPGYWGLLALDEHGYNFESSIGANNIDFFHGSVVPYNIVMANSGFYKSTHILEVAPTYHDDYHFLKIIKEVKHLDSIQLQNSLSVYSKYLETFWNHAVKPYHGLMVFLGHPQFVGYNDVTARVLSKLVNDVKADNTWMTSIDELAVFREKLMHMQFKIEALKSGQKIIVKAPEGISLADVCINVEGKVKKASASKGKAKINEKSGRSQIIFEAFDGQVITIHQ